MKENHTLFSLLLALLRFVKRSLTAGGGHEPADDSQPSNDFLSELQRGTLGVSMTMPNEWKVIESFPGGAILGDKSRRVNWHVRWLPRLMDLAPDTEDDLRQHLEQESRLVFREFYDQDATSDNGQENVPLRIDDETWSPIVSVDRIHLESHPALSIIHRFTIPVRKLSRATSWFPAPAVCSSPAPPVEPK